jgi:glycosyltransferase involved in cell wall biosynthesis
VVHIIMTSYATRTGIEGRILRDIECGELRAPAKVIDIDIACDYGDEAVDVARFATAWCLVRDNAVPVATRFLDVETDLSIALATLRDHVAASGLPQPIEPVRALDAPLTVVICTRDRPESLQRTLASLAAQSDSGFDVLIVDNSRDGDIARSWDGFDGLDIRCCHEPAPGLSRARNRGLSEVRNKFVAWIDDDEVADRDWVSWIKRGLATQDRPDAVAGVMFPAELETNAQVDFERYGGHNRGRGLEPVRLIAGHPSGVDPFYPIPNFGSGGNMAFRTEALRSVGGFDTRLGAGTLARAGEETRALSLLLDAGSTILHWPPALTWHYHRRTDEELEKQFFGYSAGLTAFYMSLVLSSPKYAWRILGLVPRGVKTLWMRNPGQSNDLPADYPENYLRARRKGVLQGGVLYLREVHRQRNFALHHGMEGCTLCDIECGELRAPAKVIDIDIACDYGDEAVDVARFATAWCLVRDNGVPVATRFLGVETDSSIALAGLRDRFVATSLPRPVEPLNSLDAPVTVVICTRDRPESLQRTLASLAAQSDSGFDVLIVDNSSDGEVASTLVDFEGLSIRCCHEPVPGLSRARNLALSQVRNEFIAFIDDDEVVDPHWMAWVKRGFALPDQPDVVSGPILPIELETNAQVDFERYGGHNRGRGLKPVRLIAGTPSGVDPLYPLPKFGSGGNMAFRTEALCSVGGFDTRLGAGTLARAGEETRALSLLLDAGSTIQYWPPALTWHNHRRTDEELEKQFFNYSASLTAFYMSLVLSSPKYAWRILGLVPRGVKTLWTRNPGYADDLPADYPKNYLRARRKGALQGGVLYLREVLRQRRSRRSSATARL